MPLKKIPKNNLKLLDIESLRWLVEEISKTNKEFSYRDLIDDESYNLKASLYVIVIGKTTNPSTKTMLEVTRNVINYLNKNNPDLIKKLKFYNIWQKDDWKDVWKLLDCNAQEFNELEYNIRQENNSLHKEYLKLGMDYFAIIISDMSIKKKISECINSYRTPEHLVQKVKTLVGRYEDQNGIIVHSFPEDIVRSYAYSSSRHRRHSIKIEWRRETMKNLVARAIEDLDGYDKRYDRYGKNSLQHIAKSTLRKKIIYKAFEYLITENMINVDTTFDIFTFNNCEFLKYAENNIDGHNKDIRKYELGSLLYTHMSE